MVGQCGDARDGHRIALHPEMGVELESRRRTGRLDAQVNRSAADSAGVEVYGPGAAAVAVVKDVAGVPNRHRDGVVGQWGRCPGDDEDVAGVGIRLGQRPGHQVAGLCVDEPVDVLPTGCAFRGQAVEEPEVVPGVWTRLARRDRYLAVMIGGDPAEDVGDEF